MKIPLEKDMAAHSSILAWRTLWTEEPGRLQSMGSQRIGHCFIIVAFSQWEIVLNHLRLVEWKEGFMVDICFTVGEFM